MSQYATVVQQKSNSKLCIVFQNCMSITDKTKLFSNIRKGRTSYLNFASFVKTYYSFFFNTAVLRNLCKSITGWQAVFSP